MLGSPAGTASRMGSAREDSPPAPFHFGMSFGFAELYWGRAFAAWRWSSHLRIHPSQRGLHRRMITPLRTRVCPYGGPSVFRRALVTVFGEDRIESACPRVT